jgi:hypothetical protein
LALLLFRLWIMALSSAGGTLLMAYSGLCLAHTFAKVDVVTLAEKRALTLNWLGGGVVLLGLLAQLLLDRRRGRGRKQSRRPLEQRQAPAPTVPATPARPWWSRAGQLYRRAG